MREIPDSIARAIEAASVPALPQALLRLLELVDDDMVTTAQLARVVEQDPGLCARLLTAANSPALRRGADLSTVEDCLIALGTRLIRSIATCLAVRSMFERSGAVPRIDLAEFWRHSLHVAELARIIAAADGFASPDHAYLAGLLHDVGILLMLSAIGDEYAELLERSAGEPQLAGWESLQFGVHHGEVGTWLIDGWNLADSFADAVLFHHEEAARIESAGRLPQIVWLAQALVADEAATASLAPLAGRLFGAAVADRLASFREQAGQCMRGVAEALGVAVAANASGSAATKSLPRLVALSHRPAPAEEGIDASVGSLAALQPLQLDLFALESDAELLLSLREAARILFDLSRSALLLADRDRDTLSGATIGGQNAVFRHSDLRPEERRCLAATAVADGRICCSFEPDTAPLSLLDRQHLRALASDGLLCVPMIARRRTVGVMIFGLSAAQHIRLARRQPWLLNFARIAAASLETWQDARAYRRQADSDAAARFERQAQRVVHEAGNPLGIIKGYLKLLDKRLPAEAGVHEELAVLREEIDRVASIVRRMSDLPAAESSAAGFDVVGLIREMLSLYREALFATRKIDVETEFGGVVGLVSCDRDSVAQILLNLWKNAAEAMPEGGRYRLAVSETVGSKGAACIEVRMDDSGPGLSPALIRHLTQPDLEAASAGRGIGLSIIGTLAAHCGIEIVCRGGDGGGTTTTLYLPRR